jgi:DNA-binding IclR family transcriptional regulator
MPQSSGRILDVLELIIEQPQTASAVARAVNVHRSTALRVLQMLESRGYVVRIDGGVYTGGRRVIELGAAVHENTDLRSVAAQKLSALHRLTRLTVHLAAIDGHDVIYLDKHETRTPIRIWSRIGASIPIHCTGVGKAILAWSSQRQLSLLRQNMTLTRFTESTIIDWNTLEEDLSDCRRRGFAIDNGEHEPYVRCIAAPVLDIDGHSFASISVTTIALDPLEDLQAYSGSLLDAAAEISLAAGAKPRR